MRKFKNLKKKFVITSGNPDNFNKQLYKTHTYLSLLMYFAYAVDHGRFNDIFRKPRFLRTFIMFINFVRQT